MAKYLVIVESPAKVKTIKKFLGANYEVEASNGHVRDFPKSQFGIDVDNDFEPKYITIRGKGELLAKLRNVIYNFTQLGYIKVLLLFGYIPSADNRGNGRRISTWASDSQFFHGLYKGSLCIMSRRLCKMLLWL